MDVCVSANRIGTYTASTNPDIYLMSKNVDAVTVEANLVACDHLTIQGVEISTATNTKTQNITSATTNVTNFTGMITAADLSATQMEIDAIIPKAGTGITVTDAGVVNPILTIIPTQNRIGLNYETPVNTIDVRSGITATLPSFLVDATNSRIGMGTTSLSYPLHIVSSATTTSVPLAAFLVPALPVSGNCSLFVGTTTSNYAALRYQTSATNTSATNSLALSVGSTNVLTSTNAVASFNVPLYANAGQIFPIAWAATTAVNNFKAENMLATSATVNSSFAPHNYRLDFTSLKATGYGVTTGKPILRVGYGGSTTTWSSNYSGSVVAEGSSGSATTHEVVTAAGIPLYPILSGTSWSEAYEHSGTLRLTYQAAAGGGYIYRWDLETILYVPGGAGAATTRGSGYIFNLTTLGRPTALGIFFSTTDLASLRLTAQIVNAQIS